MQRFDFSDIEKIVPAVFGLLYFVLFVVWLINLLLRWLS